MMKIGRCNPNIGWSKKTGNFLKKYVNAIILSVSRDEIGSVRTEIVDLIGFLGSDVLIYTVFVYFGFSEFGRKVFFFAKKSKVSSTELV